jgi:hypothetical protein
MNMVASLSNRQLQCILKLNIDRFLWSRLGIGAGGQTLAALFCCDCGYWGGGSGGQLHFTAGSQAG